MSENIRKNEKKVNELLSCYGHIANEETALFNKRSSWNNEDTLDEKYLEFLAPHSRRYFSRLRPLFSFEVKSLTSLNAFSHILFQDGVLHLMRFFQRFPHPKGLISKILIHENLTMITPRSWREHILYYRLQGRENPSDHIEKENLFLHISFAQYHSDERAVEELREVLKKYKGKVFAIAGLNIMRGEDYLNYDRSYAFEQSSMLFKGIDVEFIDLQKVSQAISSFGKNSDFLVYNPYQYWFSDSYLDHFFFNLGLSSLHVYQGSDNFIPMGPHHGMVISKDGSVCNDSATYKFLFEDMGYPAGELFKLEPPVDRNIEDYFKVRYTSQALEKLSFEVAKRLRKER